MLKLTSLEFFFRIIPETFIVIWGIYTISRKSIDIKRYIVSCLALSTIAFIIRYLPIYYGVHTEICIISTVVIMWINGIELIKVIQNTFLVFLLLSLSESLNLVILNLLNMNVNCILLNPSIKFLYGMPSLLLLLLFIQLAKCMLKMTGGQKYEK